MRFQWIYILLLACWCSGCKKYLDAKPDKALVVPGTLNDLQTLLDDSRTFNISYPAAGEVASDDYFLATPAWQSLGITDRNSYIWEKDVFNDNDYNEWYLSYVKVYTANVVLETLEKPDLTGSVQEKAAIKGQALFFRGYAFYHLLQVFAPPFRADSAQLDPGIPLRLSSDLNRPSQRATVRQSYEQVIRDIEEAAGLLPAAPLVKTRPSRNAAYAFLSRVYLNMGDYKASADYADSALQFNGVLLDFNELNGSAAFPVPLFNEEVIFQSSLYTSGALAQSSAIMDTALLQSYDSSDLRLSVFFKKNGDGSYAYKGSYNGGSTQFSGLANDELYLNRAEALARQGKTAEAMQDLNILLSRRWKTGTFVPLTASNAVDALSIILQERRKELLMRGLRWSDLRRLNKEPQWARTLVRHLDNQVYTLLPQAPGYTFPIPAKVIEMTGMPQNP